MFFKKLIIFLTGVSGFIASPVLALYPLIFLNISKISVEVSDS